MATDEPSLRERKKQATRTTIADRAAELFAARGFHAVTVEEVAHAAGVSKQTVFNYFPVKEDLLYDRADEVHELMVSTVRDRPPGMTVLEAFRDMTRSFWLRIAELPDDHPQSSFFQIRRDTPALRSYERELAARTIAAVAEVLRGEMRAGPDDPRPEVIAAALSAAHHSTFAVFERRFLAGEPRRRILPDLLVAIDRAYGVLAAGLAEDPR